MTYHLVYLLIDFYQSHLCLCTDDESSVFKSKSQGNTCIETVVTHFPVYHTAESVYLELVSSLHTAAAIIVSLTGSLACHTYGRIRADTQRGMIILAQMEAGRYHEGDLQIQFMHFGLADVAYLVFTADGHEFQCGLQHPGLVEDIFCTDTSFVSYLGVTTGVFSMKMGGTDSSFCMKGQRALCQTGQYGHCHTDGNDYLLLHE
jgi:hypothetical protein